MTLLRLCGLAHALLLALAAEPARAQTAQNADSAVLRVLVLHDSLPVERALVRAGQVTRLTDTAGAATLLLAPGAHTVLVTRLGFLPRRFEVTLRPAQDTTVAVQLEPRGAELESVVVAATRAERRVEDTPLRVEVVDEEEIAEKVAMTPGDISMLLNETSGLRVQTTSPSLGGAGVRVQGLRGRYTLLLADGLPLYGGQSGGLGLLQIPPVDLARVEVIKGTASALYGSSALGGVVNLISRRADTTVRELLLNQTTRRGTDAVLFLSGRIAEETPWSGTLLASGHRQSANDINADGWADIPEYQRGLVRPRLFYDNESGTSLYATAGYTAENREGGTLAGRVAPDGLPFVEALRTRRADAGFTGRTLLRGTHVASIRASAADQRHAHQFGAVREDDSHRTAFAEASLVSPLAPWTFVVGAAFQLEGYRNERVASFDYDHRVPAVFAQADVDAAPWLLLSGSARVDRHNVHGTILSPRGSVLLRTGDGGSLPGWTVRASAGGGSFAPTPFTEETEATGLSALVPYALLAIERAVGGSLDVGGPVATPVGLLELNATVFGSRLKSAVVARATDDTAPNSGAALQLVNAPLPTRTWGAEGLLRLVHDPLRVTATYAYTRGSEWDPERGGTLRRSVPLIPRHSAGVVGSLENEGVSRIAVELYYTGRQSLADNPYRTESRPYLIVGALAERAFETPAGRARLFLNAENLLDVRQTRVDPLLLPAPGPGGRRTTDVWSLLEGRTFNGGVRLAF
ncbi:hypothetical protein BH23GEM2_BH23GEM2_20480 [soil metagenome]